MLEVGLKDKLKEEFKTSGKATLSSADLGSFTTPAAGDKPTQEEVVGDVDVTATATHVDPMVTLAEEGDTGKHVGQTVAKDAGDARIEPLAETQEEVTMLERLVLTEAEREAFLDAIVSGNRYVAEFVTFGGRVKGKFRCRSQAESYAIMQQLNRECRSERVNNALEYATRLRNMLLAAQVAEINGEAYTEFNAPLLQTTNGSKVDLPGWLAQVDVWEARNEALIAALYTELKKFERKYWLMVDNAADQNFWNPVEST